MTHTADAIVSEIYDEWKRRERCGSSQVVSLLRRPRWKMVLLVPWLWFSHFIAATKFTTTYQAARLATFFVVAFWQYRQEPSR
jgi:hypothetical protein